MVPPVRPSARVPVVAPETTPAPRPSAAAGVVQSLRPTTSTPVVSQEPLPPQEEPRKPEPTPATAKRSINPFLNNDPNQKARRLARALVSDMVAYQPDKQSEGLKDGTLKTLFREEVKKSYEEYVEQVGKEFAETTTHFTEALNDLLAKGEAIF